MIIACVRTGTRYSLEYVERLRNMVERHMPPIAYSIVCLTDRPFETVERVRMVNISGLNLPSWWAKMFLFQKKWRTGHRVVYFDLDTVICGDLSPLVAARVQFGICENFTRIAGNSAWPCRYGSCVMVLGSDVDGTIWTEFERRGRELMIANEVYGDQRAIEMIEPNATFLQSVLPEGYMISYRDLRAAGPGRAAIVNFGGSNKPDTCKVGWVREAWG